MYTSPKVTLSQLTSQICSLCDKGGSFACVRIESKRIALLTIFKALWGAILMVNIYIYICIYNGFLGFCLFVLGPKVSYLGLQWQCLCAPSLSF